MWRLRHTCGNRSAPFKRITRRWRPKNRLPWATPQPRLQKSPHKRNCEERAACDVCFQLERGVATLQSPPPTSSGASKSSSGASESSSGTRESSSGTRESSSGTRESSPGTRESSSGTRESSSGEGEATDRIITETNQLVHTEARGALTAKSYGKQRCSLNAVSSSYRELSSTTMTSFTVQDKRSRLQCVPLSDSPVYGTSSRHGSTRNTRSTNSVQSLSHGNVARPGNSSLGARCRCRVSLWILALIRLPVISKYLPRIMQLHDEIVRAIIAASLWENTPDAAEKQLMKNREQLKIHRAF